MHDYCDNKSKEITVFVDEKEENENGKENGNEKCGEHKKTQCQNNDHCHGYNDDDDDDNQT